MRVFGFPAAFITAIERCSGWARFSAFGTEVAFVDRATGAGPALVGWLGLSALTAKTPGVFRAAGASPAAFRSVLLRLLRRLLYTELVQVLRVDTAGLLSHAKAHEAGHSAVLLAAAAFIAFGLCLNQAGSGH